jgi:hypothetical protein
MTKTPNYILSGGTMDSGIWYLVNPVAGSNQLVVSYYGGTDARDIVAISLSGTDTSSPLERVATSTGDTPSASTTITTTNDGDWLVDSITVYGATAPVASGGTKIYATTTSGILGGSQYFEQSTAGAKWLGWTWTTIGDISHLVAAFKATVTSSCNITVPQAIIIE